MLWGGDNGGQRYIFVAGVPRYHAVDDDKLVVDSGDGDGNDVHYHHDHKRYYFHGWFNGSPEDCEPKISHILRRESSVPNAQHVRHCLQHFMHSFYYFIFSFSFPSRPYQRYNKTRT